MVRGENRHNLFLLAALEGLNTVQIAEAFGVDRVTVQNALDRPENRARLLSGREAQIEAVVQRGAKEIIAQAAAEAAENLVTMMRVTESERIKLASINSILDRAGYVPPSSSNTLSEREPPRLVIQDLTVNIDKRTNQKEQTQTEVSFSSDTPMISIEDAVLSQTSEKEQV